MASLEKKRQIERWALDVAECANGIDELRLSDILSPRTAEPFSTERLSTSRLSKYPTKTYAPTNVKPVTTRLSPPPRKEPQIVRVVVQPSSSEGSAKALPERSRSARSPKRYVVNTSGSMRAYADSIESSVRRRRSPPRSVRSRRSPSPAKSSPRYNVIRRIIKPPPPPEPETRSRYYSDDRSRFYDEDRLRRPMTPPKPSRPRPRSVDARAIYYSRPRSPETKRTVVRSPSTERTYYTTRTYRDEPRRNVSVRSRGGGRYGDVIDVPRDDGRADAAKRLSQLYDDVDRLRAVPTRRTYPEEDSRRRRRSFVYSHYDDYDDYDDRRLVR